MQKVRTYSFSINLYAISSVGRVPGPLTLTSFIDSLAARRFLRLLCGMRVKKQILYFAIHFYGTLCT